MSKISTSAKILLASSLMVIGAAASAADNGFYAGASYSNVKAAPNDGGSFRLGTLGVLGGYQVNKYIGVEGRLASGVKDADVNFGEIPATVSIDSFAAINAIGSYPLGNGVSAYGTLGYGQTRFKFEALGESEKDKLNAFNYGAGLQYKTGPYAVRLGYESLANKSGITVDGVTLTGVYNF